jgi:hypothetical protein
MKLHHDPTKKQENNTISAIIITLIALTALAILSVI